MEPIKVELFDCEQYIVTIDDLVVELIEALKPDKDEYGEYDWQYIFEKTYLCYYNYILKVFIMPLIIILK